MLVFLQNGIALFAQTKSRPNIIYIYADNLGYGELGSYGQQKMKMPNLDLLAKEGIRFTDHYTGAPVCAPARCMLMTGKHSGHSYIRGNYELGGFEDDKEGGQMPLPEGTFTIDLSYPGMPLLCLPTNNRSIGTILLSRNRISCPASQSPILSGHVVVVSPDQQQKYWYDTGKPQLYLLSSIRMTYPIRACRCCVSRPTTEVLVRYWQAAIVFPVQQPNDLSYPGMPLLCLMTNSRREGSIDKDRSANSIQFPGFGCREQ